MTAAGAYLWDTEGRRYLDFLSVIAVNGVGHCHPRVVQAIQEQAAKLMHVSNLYYIEQLAELAEFLCRLGGMESVSGQQRGRGERSRAEVARKPWQVDQRLETGWLDATGHSRSLRSALSRSPARRSTRNRMLPDPERADRTLERYRRLEGRVSEDTAAHPRSPSGEDASGPHPMSISRRPAPGGPDQALLIFDEVQTGCGRTGSFFAWQGLGVKPDIVTTAKAMGGGFPIGACLAHGSAAEVFQPGDHGTTYGGGPLACAAAIAALRTIEDEGLTSRASEMGLLLKTRRQDLGRRRGAVEVRGKGLMLAMVLKDPVARDVLHASFEEGLLINAIGSDVLRFLPPLIITREQLDECVGLLEKAFDRIGA